MMTLFPVYYSEEGIAFIKVILSRYPPFNIFSEHYSFLTLLYNHSGLQTFNLLSITFPLFHLPVHLKKYNPIKNLDLTPYHSIAFLHHSNNMGLLMKRTCKLK